MRHLVFFVLLICGITHAIQSQNQKILSIRSTCKVYRMPSFKSKPIGVYARGGMAIELKKFNNGWSEILVENGEKAYVLTEFLATTLNGNDRYEKDPDDFVRPNDEDAEYGSPHLFIRGAGVRARALFSKNKPVTKIFRTNEPVSVSYLPYDEDKLVKIDGGGYAFDRQAWLFTQKKFLGRRLNFNETVKEYRALPATDTAKRKILAERIYEMSWREKNSDNIQGVSLFLDYLKQHNNTLAIANVEFEKMMLANLREPRQDGEAHTSYENGKLSYIINNVYIDSAITPQLIQQINLPYIISKKPQDLPEVGPEVDVLYKFADVRIYYNTIEKWGMIDKISFAKTPVTINIGNKKINNATTEKEFIQQFSKQYSIANWLDTPHTYYLHGPSETMLVIEFMNGKIKSFYELGDCC